MAGFINIEAMLGRITSGSATMALVTVIIIEGLMTPRPMPAGGLGMKFGKLLVYKAGQKLRLFFTKTLDSVSKICECRNQTDTKVYPE